MNNGILLALRAYATYAWSDAAIKALGGHMSIFEIGFYLTLIAGVGIFLESERRALASLLAHQAAVSGAGAGALRSCRQRARSLRLHHHPARQSLCDHLPVAHFVTLLLMLRATRFAPASHMATTHYSQMVWAVLLGALIFHEEPDSWTIIGLAVVAGSGLLTMARERIRLGAIRWNRMGRNRLWLREAPGLAAQAAPPRFQPRPRTPNIS